MSETIKRGRALSKYDWAWNDADRTSATSGNWTVGLCEGRDSDGMYWARHVDFPGFTAEYNPDRGASGLSPVGHYWDAIKDFKAWTEYQPPAEPTGFGYKGYFSSEEHGLVDVIRLNTPAFLFIPRSGDMQFGRDWAYACETLGDFYPKEG